MKVLVVDDEPQLLRAMGIILRARDHDVELANTGEAALTKAASARPDVVVLDLGLPGMGGMDVIAGLRGWTNVPIIVLSAHHDGTDKVAALDAGADDYVTKPFAMDELMARLRAAARRGTAGVTQEAPVVEAGDLRIDLAARKVTRSGVAVRLTPTEWSLVDVLVRNRGRLVTQTYLLREVWGPACEKETSYLRVNMARLRAKLEPTPSAPRWIVTEPGIGYRFEG